MHRQAEPLVQNHFVKRFLSSVDLQSLRNHIINFNCAHPTLFHPSIPARVFQVICLIEALRKRRSSKAEFDIKAIEKFIVQLIRFAMEMPQSESLCPFKFEDPERTITGTTPFKLAGQQAKTFGGSRTPHSTLAYELALEELPARPQYSLHSRILKHTSVTERMRARLRVFLMAECAKQWLFRETCVLACTLADLYLCRQGAVEVDQFQSMVVACLVIAAKAREGAFPAISERAFGREELVEWEKRVITTLTFQLNPPTYYSHAQRAVLLWDHFTQEQNCYNLKFSEQTKGVNGKLRRFYQQLDCVFMALESLDFDLEVIVLNLFYLHARMQNVYEIDAPFALSDQEFTKFFYPSNDNFRSFFGRFLLRYSSRCGLIEADVGCYLKQFLRVPAVKKEWPLQTKQHYQKIREWDEVQTIPVDCYANVKAILAKIKQRP